MGIVNKLLGKEEKEEKKDNRQSRDQARRERIRAPAPVKTSILDKLRSSKQSGLLKNPKKIKAIKATKRADQGRQIPKKAENSKISKKK